MFEETAHDTTPQDEETPRGKRAKKVAITADTVEEATSRQLLAYVERIEHCLSEIADLRENIKDIKSEAKSSGFHVRAIMELIKERQEDPDEVAELETMKEVYRRALALALGSI